MIKNIYYGKENMYMLENIFIETMHVKEKVENHNHDFLELAYIKSGFVTHISNNKETHLKQNDYIIVDYGVVHSYDNMSEDLVIINCLFKPSLIDKSLLYCKSLSQLLNNYLINIGFELNQQIFINNVFHDNNDNVLTLLNKISIEYETQTTGYIQLIRSIIIEIIIMTMRKIQNSQQILANNQDKEIAEIISYIDKNILNDFTLNDFAIKFNTSLSNLSKKFKNQTGFNFIKYIQIKRIESACRLLSNTCEKIPDIAFKSGYNDIKFFNEIFKKFIGKTPTQYRNTYVK